MLVTVAGVNDKLAEICFLLMGPESKISFITLARLARFKVSVLLTIMLECSPRYLDYSKELFH